MHNILLFQDPLSNKFNKYGGLQYSSAFTRDSERKKEAGVSRKMRGYFSVNQKSSILEEIYF